MIPYFDEGSYRQKDFHVWDNELDTTDKQSSKQWRDQSDPLRDFYFMSEDETTDFLGKLGGGDTVTKYADDRDHAFTAEEQDAIKAAQASAFDMMQVHDDVSWGETWDTYGTDEQKEYYGKYGQYVRTLQDMRSGMELWQDYLTSEPGNIYTTHMDENEASGSRALRRIINDSGFLGYDGELKGQMDRPQGSTAAEMQLNALDRDTTGSAFGKTYAMPEGDWLVEERRKAMGVLYESQQRAGNRMKFGKLYGDVSKIPKDVDIGWLTAYDKDDVNALPGSYRGSRADQAAYDRYQHSKGSIQKYAWRLYTDGTWEVGDVTSDAGLRDALRQIEASGDSSLFGTSDYRNSDQRDYLANKAYVRYLNNKLDQMGLREQPAKDTNLPGRSQSDLQLGVKAFGLDPTYSYADDYAKWGWSTKPFRSNSSRKNMAKYPEDQWSDTWRDHDTQSEGFQLSTEDLAKAQVMPDWMRQLNDYVIGGKPTPDQIAGRYKDVASYNQAVDIITQRDPTYYAPADEAPEVPEEVWDVNGEGIADGVLVFDVVQGIFVPPNMKTPGLVYDGDNSYIYDTGPIQQIKPKKAPEPLGPSGVPDPPEQPPESDYPELAGFGGGWGSEPGDHYDFYDEPEIEEPEVVEEEPKVEQIEPEVAQPIEQVAVQPEPLPEPEPVKKQTVPDQEPTAGSHVHEEAFDDDEQPPLPDYMQHQHRDREFQHSSAPMHLPPVHTKVI
jgi:hypothetical protein